MIATILTACAVCFMAAIVICLVVWICHDIICGYDEEKDLTEKRE